MSDIEWTDQEIEEFLDGLNLERLPSMDEINEMRRLWDAVEVVLNQCVNNDEDLSAVISDGVYYLQIYWSDFFTEASGKTAQDALIALAAAIKENA